MTPALTPAETRHLARIQAELTRLVRYDDESVVHERWIRQRYDLGAAASYAPARTAGRGSTTAIRRPRRSPLGYSAVFLSAGPFRSVIQVGADDRHRRYLIGLIGGGGLRILPELLRPVADYQELFLAALVIVVMMFLPGGLVELVRRAAGSLTTNRFCSIGTITYSVVGSGSSSASGPVTVVFRIGPLPPISTSSRALARS